MSISGLFTCSRFAQPPNSLSLCGPDSKKDLTFYSTTQYIDEGASNILSQFSTLYPYLSLIAKENNLRDPFDIRVVEAYWIGNSFLSKVSINHFASHLSDVLNLKKKISRKELNRTFSKLNYNAFPHHSFHVLNIYYRTGHLPIPHTLETMEACLVREGKVEQIFDSQIIIKTKPLKQKNNKLFWGESIKRTISAQDKNDILLKKIKPGDWISYHWGKLCQRLSKLQLQNLIYYTNLSLNLANQSI